MLLANVALGKPNLLYTSKSDANNLPKGTNSTHGVGRNVPDPKGDIKYEGKSLLATGKTITPKENEKSCLFYNEFIVYDVDQVEL